jgi:hypothetical protein
MKKIILLVVVIITMISCSSSKKSLSTKIESDSTKVVSVIDTIYKEEKEEKIDGVKLSSATREEQISKSSTDFRDKPSNKVVIKHKSNNNIIKKENDEIKIGNVLYQTPDTMILLVESKVIVRISKGKLDTNQITQDLSGPVTIVPINVTSKMEVKLVDPSPDNDPSFNIKSVNKSEQVIEDEVYTQWDFTVVPLKSGDHELKLVVSIIKGGEVKEQVWSDNIRVKNNVPEKVLTFWEKYWQWLLTTIIIPLVVYFWKKREDKKKKD